MTASSRFHLDAERFLSAIMGQTGMLGSPIPDSVSIRPPDAESSGGPGAPHEPNTGAVAALRENE